MTRTIASPPVREAEQILDEADNAPKPASAEGTALIDSARARLLGELDVHARLLNGCLDWTVYGPDLEWAGGDPQESAIAIAAEDVLEAAKALRNALRHARDLDRAAGRKNAATERKAS